MKKYLIKLSFIAILFLVFAGMASAHAVVVPKEAGVGKFITFTLGVPVEKDMSTTGVRLLIPEGLNHVTPNVKPGWQSAVREEGSSVSELVWLGGSIPSGYRDEFVFSAQVPAAQTTLAWKVYQTYADGSTVSWDLDPKAEQPKTTEGKSDFSQSGPYSVTEVIDDLVPQAASEPKLNKTNVSLILSIVALVLAGLALQGKGKISKI